MTRKHKKDGLFYGENEILDIFAPVNGCDMIKLKDGFQGSQAYILPPAIIRGLESNPLSAVLHFTDIGYYPHADHHYRLRTEPIEQYVFIYCTAGSGWYELAGKRYRVKADNYFILPKGMPHAYGSSYTDPWTIYWIHFKGSLAGEFMPDVPGPVDMKPAVKSRIADRLALFEEIMHSLEQGFSYENLLYACSALHLFLATLRFRNQFRAGSVRGRHAMFDPVETAIHYMKENVGKQLKLMDIAEFAGYSSSQFTSLFTQRTGFPPMEYFNQLKIKRACELLDFTEMKVNQICHKIGISDSYYFSRLFKKVMGCAPSDYRKSIKG